MLGLADTFLGVDLGAALRRDMGVLPVGGVGRGWAFVERQKRMTFDGDELATPTAALLAPAAPLIAVGAEGRQVRLSYQGQMNFTPRLDRHERQAGRDPPIGLILCTEASRDQIELLEMHKDGIVVAEYWTGPCRGLKAELEAKIREIYREAQERLARRQIAAGGDDDSDE